MTSQIPVSLRQQFADTMLAVGQSDPDLAVLLGDISHFIMQPFAEACPGRFYNVGICEPTIVSMGAGLAKVGMIPVMHTIATFLIERSFEQIKLDFCYQKLGGNLITVGSAFDYSNLGCTHHCYDDWALLKTLPDAQIFYPASPIEFDALFTEAYRSGSVNLFRLPGTQHGQSFGRETVRIGKGVKVVDGSDLTILATGPHLDTALSAREKLANDGLSCEVLYVHTIRPLDEELVRASVGKTRRILVVEEHMRSGGLGDDVLRVVRDLHDVKVSSLSIPDKFVTGYGSYEDLCGKLGFTPQGIVDLVRSELLPDVSHDR